MFVAKQHGFAAGVWPAVSPINQPQGEGEREYYNLLAL